ncbi:MAG: 30S ribosome-binding factor RbfA [Lentisphaerae bacterium]|nr:30S ribosome-binding factor RbfA [Lentisphaerota bacterium]
MSVDRLERVNALLRREIAEAVPVVMLNEGVDCAAITVTQVRVARNLRNATVSVSILGHERERQAMIRKLAHRHVAFQRLINRDMKLKYTPVLQFTLDESIEKGDHVLDVLTRLAAANPALAAAEEPAAAPPADDTDA